MGIPPLDRLDYLEAYPILVFHSTKGVLIMNSFSRSFETDASDARVLLSHMVSRHGQGYCLSFFSAAIARDQRVLLAAIRLNVAMIAREARSNLRRDLLALRLLP